MPFKEQCSILEYTSEMFGVYAGLSLGYFIFQIELHDLYLKSIKNEKNKYKFLKNN